MTKRVEGSASVLRPGTTLTWTVTATNTGDTSFDGALRRAIVVDDLVDVLDDARLGDVAASTGSVSVEGSRLVWSGALASGASVSITYDATVTAAGDLRANNVAFVADAPDADAPEECAEPVCATTTSTLTTADRLPQTGTSITWGLIALALALVSGGVWLLTRRGEAAEE